MSAERSLIEDVAEVVLARPAVKFVWRDIESAPRDGSLILATGWNHRLGEKQNTRHYRFVYWDESNGGFQKTDGTFQGGPYHSSSDSCMKYLTHWAYIPEL
jgi:hypothetical protein